MKLTVLQEVAAKAATCIACGLHKNRIKSVFSSGSFDAQIMIVGEAPGADEDQQGLPFVGRSGQLLNKILLEIGLDRGNIYVANICKCRPPDNRKPHPHEMSACFPFLEKQIETINPKIIVTLGATAIEGLCGSGLGITKRRGKVEKYKEVDVLPSLHPSYCLRNPPVTKDLKSDLLIAKEMAYGKTDQT